MAKLFFWTVGAFVVCGAALLVVRLACVPVNLANKALDSAEGVVDRTIAPDNVINNYEWFHDTYRAIGARVHQIEEHREILAAESDAAEKRRLRVEMTGMQQSCRDMVAQYNANTSKINRDLFRGKTAPAHIDSNICEVKP